ncbi:MAG: hypothetical protein HY898_18845 [Deltaproteobacteria bacterium]|nr:hypothetical protein [Deltaproteobacteria bacterium]
MADSGRKLVTLRGTVTESPLRRGTGSAHVGVVLVTPDGERIVLTRHGGNPFDDAQTRSLVGKTVVVKGYRIGNELRFTEAEVVD